MSEDEPTPARRPQRLAAIVGALLLLAGGALIWLLQPPPPEPVDRLLWEGPVAELRIDGEVVSGSLSIDALRVGRPAVPWAPPGGWSSFGSGEDRVAFAIHPAEALGQPQRLVIRRGSGPAVALEVQATDASGQPLTLSAIGLRSAAPRQPQGGSLWDRLTGAPPPVEPPGGAPVDPAPGAILVFR